MYNLETFLVQFRKPNSALHSFAFYLIENHTMRDGRYRQEENNSKELERSSHRDRSRMTKTRPPHQHDDRTHGRPRSNSRSLSPCHEQSPRSINETRRDTIKRIDQEREHSRPFREVAPSSSLILRGLTANVNDGMVVTFCA